MSKISVIIPVYNTVDYLEQCLRSVCNQTYSSIEIICVNDGSTDGSDKILEQFAKKDRRILLIHQNNYGESRARNVGLKIASGDYITFVDCDDWIEPDMYQRMVFAIEKENVDLVAGSWFYESDEESIAIKNSKKIIPDKFGRDKLLKYIYERDSYKGFAYMWDKLYKRSLFYDDNGKVMLFDENLQIGGDVLYLARLILNTKSAMYLDTSFYHYRQRKDSGCHSENLSKKVDWLKAYIRVMDIFEEEGISRDVIDLVKRFFVYHCSNVAELAYKKKDKDVMIYCQDWMRKYEKEYVRLNVGKREW